ncbi:transcriptional activator DEMETER-like isoform X1 [Prunus yedoensis var. nudiflora]|uniref:Transcriptional activator DEMETER-like isoform X1 n=1 Tax=Prunus yedoensis var. nudiflora TaxID=2094558 RepID=A0A314ZBD8_PRUYE|nr:transcriptional activator DEMETER-like isoform X1 [Prunus yedoensis var. nudiflora]
MSAKKKTMGSNISKSVSSGTDKVPQEQDASYDYQQPSAKAIGFPGRTRCSIPVDVIINQFKWSESQWKLQQISKA